MTLFCIFPFLGHFVKTHCLDVYKLDLFTKRFVTEFREEIMLDKHKSIQDLDYENDWLSIFNFYVSPILTYHFQAQDQTFYAALLEFVKLKTQEILYPNPLYGDTDTNYITQFSFDDEYQGNFHILNCMYLNVVFFFSFFCYFHFYF